MKKLFKFSLLALFVGFVSCEDATDIIQDNELSEENAFVTVTHLQQGLNGVYGAYAPDAGSNGDGDAILFNDLFTDNLKRGASSSGQGNQEYNFILQPLSGFPNTIWANRYATINFANRVLKAWDRIVPGFDEEDTAAAMQIKGQLLAMRALCHFDLMQYFSPDYQDLSVPSIIIVDFVPTIDQVFPRNTLGEVYTFIEKDLDDAAEAIGTFNSASTNPSFMSIHGINAIRARFELLRGNYTEAGALAQDLIDTFLIATGQGPEPEATPFAEMWLNDDETASEEIFTLTRVQGDNGIASNWYANEPGAEGSPFFEASNQLYNLYTPTDVRKNVYFFPDDPDNGGSDIVGPDSEDNLILIGKYRGKAAGPTLNDVKIFRSSEMVMILAESQARAGNLTAAATTLRNFRTQRLISGTAALPTYATLQNALVDILLERRKEFAFEGHRYLDLKRLGTELGIGVSRSAVDCASFAAQCDLLAGDYRFTLPIPRSETNANPTIQQNPGY